VAGAIRRKATWAKLAGLKRQTTDETANYLLAKAPYLDYPRALAGGWPIATGVSEGAVRHLIKDRRWALDGAEAVLRLRALHSNNDFNTYWAHHVQREHERIHAAKYLNHEIPT
jgi:hypothetical protein